jgi:hypothetical protein
MEESLVNLLASLVEGRNEWIDRMNRSTNRDGLFNTLMLNELRYLELINRIHQNHIRSTAAATALLTLAMPQNFTDPVTVSPSAAQIERATVVVSDPPANTTCAICQENVTQNATQIRHCGHMYHRDCFNQWFSMSARCPVCRHDVRTHTVVGPVQQTPPGAE